MRYNPPPNWPAPPEGWTPPAGWTPDPTWPAPPPGWRLWVEDGEALPGEPVAAAKAHKQATIAFLVGVGLFVVGAVSVIVSSGPKGGFLLTGATIFGVVSIVRAVVAYRASRTAGAPPLTAPLRVGAVAALVVCVGLGGYAGVTFAQSKGLHATAGSCWSEVDGSSIGLVSCHRSHDYKAVDAVTDDASCPDRTVGTVDGDDDLELCLVED